MSGSSHHDQLLRDHITNLLNDYVLEHLTGYIDRTEVQDRHALDVSPIPTFSKT